MNDNAQSQADDAMFDGALMDRLVDGELSNDERRHLLERLDRAPEGWRRCALAFLEAQEWGRELKGVAHTADVSPQINLASRAAGARPWHQSAWAAMTLVAASFAIALWVGMNYAPSSGAIQPSPQIAQPATSPTSPGATQLADIRPGATPGAMPQEAQPVTYTVPPVPVDRMHESMFVEGAEKALEDEGFVLEHQRKFVPMRTRDGQIVYVPVDQVDVRYVGRPYQ